MGSFYNKFFTKWRLKKLDADYENVYHESLKTNKGNLFHATGLSLYPLKTSGLFLYLLKISENFWFLMFSRGIERDMAEMV